MHIVYTRLPEVLEITPRRFGDERGFFCEIWNRQMWGAAGIDLDFCQDNHSLSTQVGVVRGLHFQAPAHDQKKLVRIVTGAVLDVAVDICKESPKYGQWVGVTLSAENGKLLLIPSGFAHGFMTLEPKTNLLYKYTNYYAPDCDRAVAWDDPDIKIDWPDVAATILSEKDKVVPALNDFHSPFTYEVSA